MIVPARTVWDTRIQCVCAVLATRLNWQVEIHHCGNFGQATLNPPRIVVNPSRLYPFESMVRESGRFSLNVMPDEKRDEVLALTRLRRRDPLKAEILGWQFLDGIDDIPFLPDSARTLFCEVESVLDTGDHTVMICRVLQMKDRVSGQAAFPLLYREIAGVQGRRSRVRRLLRRALVRSAALDILKRIRFRLRKPPPANLPEATYRDGGQTDDEIRTLTQHGIFDLSKKLRPAPVPAVLRRPLGVCVVGTRWGLFHCELVRKANPAARLFVCGQDRERTERVARLVKAEDCFVGLVAAVEDSRVQALSLALPHHLHRHASETALGHGKHVLVEKPIATTLADADAMIAAARKARCILMVAEDMHFRPAIATAVEHIERGNIGEPLHLLIHCGGVRRPEGWVAGKDKLGGGVLMDIGVHYVRAMRLLLGEPDTVTAFRAMQVNTKMSGEDGIQVVFSSRYGWRAHLLATWSATLGQLPDMALLGDKGTLHFWPRAHYLDYYPIAPRPMVRLSVTCAPTGCRRA